MVMAEYSTHDRLQELWQKIHHLHLTFLDTEDSPQKIQQRNKLELCIRDYLCIAPHNRKFFCPQTAEVLHRSASSKTDFSGYRAAVAWNAISMYAGNLLSQPWRKEYRQIKMYSGSYKHQIETNLVGAEAMFEAMGYRHAGDGILILEGPVCPDRVANVSQDSIVAFVECQILKTIWEEVSNNFKVSWLDVLEFRETHLCSPEHSIRMLNYRFHEKRYQEQQCRNYPPENSEVYSQLLRCSMPNVTHHPPPPLLGMHSFPPQTNPHIHSHIPAHSSHFIPPCTGQCIYATNPYYNSYSTYAPVPAPVPAPASSFPRYGTIPYSVRPCNGYCIPPPSYICAVPTAQLIELDNPQNGSFDMTDNSSKRQQDQLESHKQLAKSTNLDSLTLSKSKEDGAGTFESWDYVYRNLESQGYYKDLSERPDVLQPIKDKKKQNLKKTKPTIELEDEINHLNLNETNRKLEEKKSSNGMAKTAKTLPRERINVQSPEKPNHVTTLDARKLRKQDSDKLKPKEVKKDKNEVTVGGWNCNACTYLNDATVIICVMCGKSKKNVEHVMAVGGSQCPRCTLVNQRDVTVCQACDASLHNSPTYI